MKTEQKAREWLDYFNKNGFSENSLLDLACNAEEIITALLAERQELTKQQTEKFIKNYNLVKTGLRVVQRHADDLYKGASEKGFGGAGWASHEIVKYLGMIARCNIANLAIITALPEDATISPPSQDVQALIAEIESMHHPQSSYFLEHMKPILDKYRSAK